jgi:hypothetical protein
VIARVRLHELLDAAGPAAAVRVRRHAAHAR